MDENCMVKTEKHVQQIYYSTPGSGINGHAFNCLVHLNYF
jgi:hypothetical protein